MDRLTRRLMIVVSCFVTTIDMGLIFSFGTLFVAMMNEFQTNRSTTAIVQSLLVGVTLSFGVASGFLITRLGLSLVTFIASFLAVTGLFMSFFATSIHYLYISIGFMTGAGISMAFISCLTIAGQVFTGTQRLVCISAVNVSIAVGSVIYPFFLEWLRQHYGLYGTFLILSGIAGNTLTLTVLCVLNRGKIHEDVVGEGIKADRESESTNRERNARNVQKLMSVPIVCSLLALGLSVGTLNGFIQLLLDISIWRSLTESQGLMLMVAYHFFSIFSRLFPAIVKYSKNISAFICAIISALSGCVGQVILYFASGIIPYMIGVSLSSIALGGVLSSSLIILVEIVRQKQRSLAYGLLYTVNGLVSTIAGYTLGKVRDITGSYMCVLLTVGLMQVISAILFFVAFMYWRRDSTSEVIAEPRETALLASTDVECDQRNGVSPMR